MFFDFLPMLIMPCTKNPGTVAGMTLVMVRTVLSAYFIYAFRLRFYPSISAVLRVLNFFSFKTARAFSVSLNRRIMMFVPAAHSDG